jgi:predicted secreted protein
MCRFAFTTQREQVRGIPTSCASNSADSALSMARLVPSISQMRMRRAPGEEGGSEGHVKQVIARLPDARSRRVVFLSHCLLNENTRYLGGACVPGCVPEVVARCVDAGIGIVQMPCPEQLAWGGVLKRSLLAGYGLRHTCPLLYLLRQPMLALFRWRTRRIYENVARQVAREVADYVASGMEVTAIVGVDGSPSCGVAMSIDMAAAFDRIAQLPVASVTAAGVNAAIRACAVAGEGLFVEALRRELGRRRLVVSFTAYDLLAEVVRHETAGVRA